MDECRCDGSEGYDTDGNRESGSGRVENESELRNGEAAGCGRGEDKDDLSSGGGWLGVVESNAEAEAEVLSAIVNHW